MNGENNVGGGKRNGSIKCGRLSYPLTVLKLAAMYDCEPEYNMYTM